MFGSSMLDIAVGVVFSFLLFSIFGTAINEGIASFLNMRGRVLLRGIQALLDNNGDLIDKLYNSGQVCGLYEGNFNEKAGSNLPSYIPARNFALALIACVEDKAPANPDAAPGAITQEAIVISQAFKDGAAELARIAPKVGKPLVSLIATTGNDVDKLRQGIEAWFNSSMDRASGWYKSHTQRMLFLIGVVMAIALNINTLAIVHQLSKDPTLRQSMVAAAQTATTPTTTPTDTPQGHIDSAEKAFTQIDNLGIPLGWQNGTPFTSASATCSTIMGWLLTALAVSVGAPFWFDALNRIMVIRSTVKPDEKSPIEKSKS